LVLGFLYGVSAIVRAYMAAPSLPGKYELLFQTVLVGIMAAVGAALGFGVGFLVSLFQRRG